MKRAIGLAAIIVVLFAAPASADVTVTDRGIDGTPMTTFFLLAIAGVAIMSAVAALIMGRKRPPS